MNGRRVLNAGLRRIIYDESGQDMIEYALVASALAVTVAAFIPREVIPVMSGIFSRITSSMNGS